MNILSIYNIKLQVVMAENMNRSSPQEARTNKHNTSVLMMKETFQLFIRLHFESSVYFFC